jgi:DHA2 family multidrug resistance protein
MDWRPVVVAGALQGLGLGALMPALTKAAFQHARSEVPSGGHRTLQPVAPLWQHDRVAVVQVFFYDNTQAVYLALAKNLTPYRAAAHAAGSVSRPGLAALNDMVTGQAAVIAVIDQFEILMFAMLIVSPLVLFLRKPRPVGDVVGHDQVVLRIDGGLHIVADDGGSLAAVRSVRHDARNPSRVQVVDRHARITPGLPARPS